MSDILRFGLGSEAMRSCVFVVTMLAIAGECHAERRPAAPSRPYAVVRLSGTAALPPSEIGGPARRASDREYRIDPSDHAERSAHGRALDEMNAINNRRPRSFRFRPVMALTFDAADLNGPARVSGIAPNLMGLASRR
ncbi:hypothetical protein [Sphingomonas turrisvirgatae]|uniref:Uncharacterized protein n=1 Tax=Sphingomonas turrisvirgatae TaxID=1888892 RepID=A0A1E3LR10_9SPHN|nr:hypothetical protein [Sphingomonas turrisvirgatae]ODP36153.1 hypothetical protein BFL28_07015 [Sphingomonas turrisvirgatae]